MITWMFLSNIFFDKHEKKILTIFPNSLIDDIAPSPLLQNTTPLVRQYMVLNKILKLNFFHEFLHHSHYYQMKRIE